jgi:hypothetical protein
MGERDVSPGWGGRMRSPQGDCSSSITAGGESSSQVTKLRSRKPRCARGQHRADDPLDDLRPQRIDIGFYGPLEFRQVCLYLGQSVFHLGKALVNCSTPSNSCARNRSGLAASAKS